MVARFPRPLIGAAVVAALVVGACGGATLAPANVTRLHHPAFGPFAGYNWFGDARSVSGSWSVPSVEPDSSPGRAGTWIGAESPGPRGSAPFIQVGTNEERHTGDVSLYYTFWSDTVRGFHPQLLFRVSPSGQIAASLVHAGGRWTVEIRDFTSGQVRTLRTAEEGRGAFNMVGWVQEDITSEVTRRPFPYPRLARVRFTALMVNSRPPQDAALRSTWMSESGADLGPGPLRDDGFTIVGERLSMAGLRYLAIAGSEDRAAIRFVGQLRTWTSTTPLAEVGAASRQFAAALRLNAAELRKRLWPSAARGTAAMLARATTAVMAQLSVPSVMGPAARQRWQSAVLARMQRQGEIADQLRRELGLPLETPER